MFLVPQTASILYHWLCVQSRFLYVEIRLPTLSIYQEILNANIWSCRLVFSGAGNWNSDNIWLVNTRVYNWHSLWVCSEVLDRRCSIGNFLWRLFLLNFWQVFTFCLKHQMPITSQSWMMQCNVSVCCYDAYDLLLVLYAPARIQFHILMRIIYCYTCSMLRIQLSSPSFWSMEEMRVFMLLFVKYGMKVDASVLVFGLLIVVTRLDWMALTMVVSGMFSNVIESWLF